MKTLWSRSHQLIGRSARRLLANFIIGCYSPLGQRIFILGISVGVSYLSMAEPAFAQGGPGDMKGGIVTLVKGVIDLIIFIGGLVLSIGIAGNWVAGQISVAVGSPGGLSHTWLRLAGIIIAFVGLLATIPVTNVIIDQASKAIPDQTLKSAR